MSGWLGEEGNLQIRSRAKTGLLFYSDTSFVSFITDELNATFQNTRQRERGGGSRCSEGGCCFRAPGWHQRGPGGEAYLHDLEGASRDGQDLQVSDLRLGDVALEIPARAPVSQADGFPCRAEQRRGSLRYPAQIPSTKNPGPSFLFVVFKRQK